MKIQRVMASAAVLLLSATAGAQQWDGENYTYRLKGCYAAGEKVRCDFTFVLTKGTSSKVSSNVTSFQVVTTDGRSLQATSVSLAGQEFQTFFNSSTTAYKDAPIQDSVLFDLPNATSFKVLAVNQVPMNNVQIAKSAGAIAQAAPAPSSTPPAVTTPAPSAGVPTGFGLKLSNCKVSKGIYTCTATLTPTR